MLLLLALLVAVPSHVHAQEPDEAALDALTLAEPEAPPDEQPPAPALPEAALQPEPVLAPRDDLAVRTPEGTATPPPEPPAPWSPVYTGSYFTRYELRDGFDDLGISRGRFTEGDAFHYRVRFGLSTGLLDVGEGIQVALQVTPQATGTFGDRGPNTIVDTQLGLHEGYARVQGKHVRFDAGRYELVYGDALMIGNNDWNEVGRTFDGLRMRIGQRDWLDLFANVIDEGRPDFVGAGKGDYYFLGAYAALGQLVHDRLEQVSELDLYLLARVWGEATTDEGAQRERAQELTLGARAKGRFGGRYDYRTETGMQAGTRAGTIPDEPIRVDATRALAWQGDVELGATVVRERLRVALELLYATGAKPNGRGRNRGWEDLFPSGHKWLGLADAFNQDGQKRTNVGSAVLHVTATPHARVTVQFDAHVFARPEPTEVGGARGFAGGELDSSVSYLIARGLKARLLYALFVPSADLYSDAVPPTMLQRDPDPAQYFEAELRYDLVP
ncbi:MAG: alginate export family protein [Polyangiales bacterium]